MIPSYLGPVGSQLQQSTPNTYYQMLPQQQQQRQQQQQQQQYPQYPQMPSTVFDTQGNDLYNTTSYDAGDVAFNTYNTNNYYLLNMGTPNTPAPNGNMPQNPNTGYNVFNNPIFLNTVFGSGTPQVPQQNSIPGFSPQSGFPQSGFPQSGFPQSGFLQSGFPQTSFTPSIPSYPMGQQNPANMMKQMMLPSILQSFL